MEYLSLGKVIDTFSLNGTLKLISTTDNGKLRYKKGNKVFLVNPENEERKEVTVVSYRSNGQFDFVKVEEINIPEEALEYKGFEIQVVKDRNDLKEGYYFYSDLRGCTLINQEDKEFGKVIEVEEFPAQITLRAKANNGKQFFVPFIKDFIISVDIDNKVIKVNVVEGML